MNLPRIRHHLTHESVSRRGARGETLIEFALALVLFLMTVLGVMEGGILVFRYNMLANLAQEGARRAAVCGKSSGLPSSDCNIKNFVQARSLGIIASTADVDVSPSPSGLDPGATVEVRVQHTFNSLTSLVPFGPMTLRSTAQMIVSR
jgi:Flp pilus assembly protein TadG